MNEPTHLDLFSGIGGFSLAFEAEGFKTIGFSEVDPFACRVLKKNWPHVTNYGDVRSVPAMQCDVITGGFPCQPFSNLRQAGKPKGKADDRYLWPEMLGVIERCKPAWVVGENVNGFINLGIDECISDLESIGYSVQPIVVPACALGAIHRRDRVWILAHSASERCTTIEEVHTSAIGQSSCSQCEAGAWNGHSLPKLVASNQCALSLLREQPVPSEPVPSEPVPTSCGGDDGLSDELDAIKCYGNAIVPQVARVIAKGIYEQLKIKAPPGLVQDEPAGNTSHGSLNALPNKSNYEISKT